MVQNVVYNACYGGFGIKNEVIEWVRDNQSHLSDEYGDRDIEQLASKTLPGEYYSDGSGPKSDWHTYVHGRDIDRDNELLVDLVRGETHYDGQIDSRHSDLGIAEVADGIEWEIDEYDGSETVREAARRFN